jgi:putative transposase
MEQLNMFELKPDSGSTMSSPLPDKALAGKSATAGSPAPNREMTLVGKSNPFAMRSLTTKSFPILEADFTSNVKDLQPYWKPCVAEMSGKLWLPIGTDSLDLDLTLSSGLSSTTVENSWFSAQMVAPRNLNWFTIYSPSSTSLVVECTDSENTKAKLNLKSRKIEVYPDQGQVALLRRWAGTARYVFNQTVEYLKQPGTKANWKAIKTEILHRLPEWAKHTPYQIKSIAIRDACTAVKAAKKKFLQTGQFQEVKFRSRKKRLDSIFIPAKAVSSESVYLNLLGSSLRPSEPFPENVTHDCRLVSDHGRYFLSVPIDATPIQPENQRLGVVALDPGVRTFQTFYSPSLAGKLGSGDFGHIVRLCFYLDDLYSRISKAKCRQKKRMRQAAFRIRTRIKHLIDEIHHKAAHWLCTMFDVILIPSFETSQMVSKLHSQTARAMLTWAHYRFKQFLIQKAVELKARVIEVSEAYTSKTCSRCGLVQEIGSRKVLSCRCGLKIDRDYNGARGIFLRALGDTPCQNDIPERSSDIPF